VQTIKTAFVVVLLLTVLYGAREVLTQPDARPPREVADAQQLPAELQLDEGTLDSTEGGDFGKVDVPSNHIPEMSEDARPLVPPPSALPKFEDAASGRFASAPRADEAPAAPASEAFSPGAAPAIPDLAPQTVDDAALPGADEASLPPPPRGETLAGVSSPERSATDFGPGENAFVPPPPSTPPNRESDLTTVPATDSPASPFAPATISAGAFAPPAFTPPRSSDTVAGIAGLPDPQALAKSVDNEISRASARVEGTADQAARAAQDTVGKVQEFADGVRFDPKDALLSRGWRAAEESLKAGSWRQALATLSALYEDPRLTHQERQKLLDSLDPLAARVIYSNEHLVEPAYEVRRGDNLMQLGEKYNVPWQLLRNINGIADPEFLVPGSKLKVIRGPFRAEVDTVSQEMTIYLQRLYAGRFPLSIGNDPAPRQGDFEIQRKEPGRPFYAANGVVLPAGDVKNPYGRCWLDLGSDVSIHGTALEAGGPTSSGCVSLSPRDADDVFAILSVGSRVSIR